METKREAAQTPCSCDFRVTFIRISHYISATFWNYSHFGLQVLIWFQLFIISAQRKISCSVYKNPNDISCVPCQFNFASRMETRLVSFMSVGAVRQMSRTGTEVFSLAHIGELWIFNILPYKTETRRCKICVSVWARRWECDWEDNEIKMENKRHRIHSHTVLPIQSLSAGYASLWHTGSGLWSASTNLLYVHTVILLCYISRLPARWLYSQQIDEGDFMLIYHG